MLLTFLGLIALGEAFPQTLCTQTLNDAQNDFDGGYLYGIPAKLKDCLDNGFTKQERIQAYKLLTITYLYIDDPIAAENSYLNLLRLDPEHQLNPNIDPIEIIYLSKKFTTRPNFSLHLVKLGFNLSDPTSIHNNGVDNTAFTLEETKLGFGFQVGSGADLHLTNNLSLAAEIQFGVSSFDYKNTLFRDDIQKSKERHTWVQVPVFVRYTLIRPKFQPFVYAGYAVNLMLGADLNIEHNDQTPKPSDINSFVNAPVTGPNLSIAKLRKTLTSSLVFGIGFKYRLNYEYLTFDIRAVGGLSNVLDTEKQFDFSDADINELRFRYGFVEDDFRMNSIAVSFGYIKPLYFPRKITKGTLGSKIRNLFKKRNGN